MSVKIGIGIDVHAFEAGKVLVLGGIEINGYPGLKGHSDGDVVVHSIIDALLGAANLGDIGEWFGEKDPKYESIDSKELLREVVNKIVALGFKISQVDVAVLCEVPKVSEHRTDIVRTIEEIVGAGTISIKGSSPEGLGSLGRNEGVMSYAVALLEV